MKASDIRKGVVIYYEGNPCRVMDFQHRTPGNLRAFVQVRMRNLKTGNSFETRFASTEDLQTAQIETKEMQVLYDDGSLQAWADATYGAGLVEVTSALEPVAP